MKELLTLRKAKKLKKPTFNHQDSWKRKRLPKKWRKPKGLHSKMRLKFKGNPKLPSPGYRSPGKVRGLHGSGLKTVLVRSLKQMENLTSEAIIIASSFGAKKRLEIIKKAGEKKLRIINLDPDKYVEKIKKSVEERSKKKDTREKAEKSLKDREGKKSENAEKKTYQEGKIKENKKEMEKVITKRK